MVVLLFVWFVKCLFSLLRLCVVGMVGCVDCYVDCAVGAILLILC